MMLNIKRVTEHTKNVTNIFMNFLYLKKNLSLDTVVYNADKLKKRFFPF